jgi:precorrin-2 dehydrogenase / sirohydrochlorin ferrochelatase
MTHQYYPVALDVRGKRCLVVGGGHIATDKVEGLVAAGAELVVVSPRAGERLAQLAGAGSITLHERPYRTEDTHGIFLAYGATDSKDINAGVARDGRRAGALVNAVDDIPNCDFFAMSIVRRGDLQVAISTNGRSPAFARWMREAIDAWIPPHYAALLQVLGEARTAIRARGAIPAYEHWRDALTGDLLNEVRMGRLEVARDHLVRRLEVLA